MPELSEHDLSHLGAYTAATRLVVDGRETAAFTLRTAPPTPPTGITAALRAAVTEANQRSARPQPPRADHRTGQ